MDRSISSRIPRSPSPVFPDDNGLGLEFHDRGHSRRYSTEYNAAEDAAREVEESILGHPSSPVRHRHRGDHHDSRKRDAATALSDAESDFDVPGQSRYDTMASTIVKKRRLEDGVEDITEDFERSVAGDDVQSISGVVAKKSIARSKGKGRATPPVAPPMLSVVSSGGAEVQPGVKIRKKPGPKKKSDLLALRAGEAGTPSAAASVVGDATPAGSSPPSPSMSTALIYEIGDAVPALKRAKRVDDQTMLKRISTLEEAQKKVWLNIARRDVAKVFTSFIPLGGCDVFTSFVSAGVQGACTWVPGPSKCGQAHCRPVFQSSQTTAAEDDEVDEGYSNQGEAFNARDDGLLEEEREGGARLAQTRGEGGGQ